MQIKFALAAVVAAVSACAHVSTNTTKLDPTVHLARTCPLGVRIYPTADRVTGQYTEVALLHSTGGAVYSDEAAMYRSMREKAAKAGANGIIIGGIDEPRAITKVAAAVFEAASGVPTDAERKGRAIAIYVPADSANSVAACANYKRPSWLRRVFS
jgi:hypothetical protein